MNTRNSVIVAALFCGGFGSVTAPAQSFYGGFNRGYGTTERSGTYRSLHHGSRTFSSTVTRQPGSTSGNTDWTNPNGGTGSRTFDNSYTSTGNGTATGTHESSTTYANGKDSSSQGDWTRTAPGDSTYSGTHTGANGNVTDVTRDTTTSNGVRTTDSTYDNTATGKVSTVDKTVSTTASGSKQVDTTATGASGKTVTSDQTFTKDSNGYIQIGTVTGPNGKTATDNKQVAYVKDANGETTRTATGSITGPNGGTKLIGNTETSSTTYLPNPSTAPALPSLD
jgi:hypothetical protein